MDIDIKIRPIERELRKSTGDEHYDCICGSKPGDGPTPGCYSPDGCGYTKTTLMSDEQLEKWIDGLPDRLQFQERLLHLLYWNECLGDETEYPGEFTVQIEKRRSTEVRVVLLPDQPRACGPKGSCLRHS